ncbi:hypothetical protein [Streptomyces sp. TLI_171]|uniref:hypothetical protein n=1 Tax=Streptomyces sp. TLI_171 TaxID=1938859 RepID=UPI000C197565|nr:hypothetical protein [Streptomyces sp. TLI_171]RKE17758.1 hypothetical protein BX266_1024 [Streptomyces sp. TLI_171]
MTITEGAPPKHHPPSDLASGFLTGGVIGAGLTAFVAGCVVGRAALVVVGLALPAAYGLLFLLGTLPRRRREGAVAPRTALAVVESLEPSPGEATDVPVRFELSVVPDDAPGYRVEVRQEVNLVELADYRPGTVVVVEYPPDRRWQVRIVRRPTPDWEQRAAEARLDSVPGPAMGGEPAPARAAGFLTLLGVLLGVAAVLVLFRADLFGPDRPAGAGGGAPPAAVTSGTTTVTSETTTVTSGTGTVALGPGRSLLDQGELRRAVEALTEDDARQALTVVVQDRLLTVVFAPSDVTAGGFDPRALPYDRVPALVEEASSSLRVGSGRSWQLTADGLTGALTLRVVVTGDTGTGTLEADGQGKVLGRSGG